MNGIFNNEVLQYLHGIGLAWSYFPHHWEVQVLKMKRPIDIFQDDKLLKKALASRIKWGGKVGLDGFMSDADLRKAIRTASGVQAVSNFRPVASASIYYKYARNGIVWDMSCGYGGRLIGALASGSVKKYIGSDPCKLTYQGLQKIQEDFKHIDMEVDLNMIGSEDFVPEDNVDLCFTSPPYFNTEEYSNEETQSWKKYPTKKEWLEGFLKKTMQNCYSCLKNDGLMMIEQEQQDAEAAAQAQAAIEAEATASIGIGAPVVPQEVVWSRTGINDDSKKPKLDITLDTTQIPEGN